MRIESEIAPLKKVILHKPVDALRRLTPNNCHEFLFDDVLWPERAAEEHDAFAQTLKDQGVEVYMLEKLLAETVENEVAKEELISHALELRFARTKVRHQIRQYLNHLSPDELVKHLLGGMTYEDLGDYSLGLCSATADKNDFLLPPLPNHLFTRDTSFWVGNGVAINHMAFPARQGETANIAAIYKHHPMFKQADFNIWLDGSDTTKPLPSIEGGDVLVISKDCILIGLGERTKPQAVEVLAKELFDANVISKIIAIELPKKRAYMHLDTLMTMIDVDTFCVAFPFEDINAWELKPGLERSDIHAEKIPNLFNALSDELNVEKLKLIYPGGDDFAQQREQWTDASNLLAIRPGTVFAYECNIHTNQLLEDHGIEILKIAGSELGRGRGGSRCMSCPILRES